MKRHNSPLPVVGVSACLLGQKVRYDGGDKRHDFLVEVLAKFVEFMPVCPETAIGMSIPRHPIQLVGDPLHPRLLGVNDSSKDYTKKMEDFARSQTEKMAHLSGYVLKKNSPSCGMEQVPVFDALISNKAGKSAGVFARILRAQNPLLPITEEDRLDDPVLRENFINRIYVFQRWRLLNKEGLTRKGLLVFHARHKYMVMAHSQAAYKRIGQLLSDLSADHLDAIATDYIQQLMSTLKRVPSRKQQTNVLQHILGYLKKRIDNKDKSDLLSSIESYRLGHLPLTVPIQLLLDYFERHPDPYITSQFYLKPYPEELELRNFL